MKMLDMFLMQAFEGDVDWADGRMTRATASPGYLQVAWNFHK